MGDEVEVLPGDVVGLSAFSRIGFAPVHDEPRDARVGDLPARDGVNEGLEIGAIAAGHDQNAALL